MTNEGLKHFVHILTLPDNIPIVMMVLLIGLCCFGAAYEMKKNDDLIKKGEKDKIYDRMIR